jgi:hypothetical protein
VTDNEQDARELLDTIQTEVLDTFDRLEMSHLPYDSQRATRFILLNALVELSGRFVTALIQDDPAMRPRCAQLVDHLALHVETAGQVRH